MATPVTVTKYKLRASSPVAVRGGCTVAGAPTSYILQTFGVEVSDVDNYDSLTSLLASEVMQGLQNFEDTDTFRGSSFTRISYNGTNSRDTDGNMVFRGTEEHTPKWVNEESSGLVWIQ